MKITPDTNVLVRALTEDDPRQSRIAQTMLAQADLVALTLHTLCELVWVLAKGYDVGASKLGALSSKLNTRQPARIPA